MDITINQAGGANTPMFSFGQSGLKILTGSLDFDTSYPLGGEVLDLSGYFPKDFVILFENVGGYTFEYDHTDKKVKAVAGAGTEATQDATPVDLEALAGVKFIAVGA